MRRDEEVSKGGGVRTKGVAPVEKSSLGRGKATASPAAEP